MPKIIEQDGKKYLIIGKRAIPFSRVDASGKPIVDVKSETKEYPDGRKDVVIKVPSLKVANKNNLK
jgi:hypothetical protein